MSGDDLLSRTDRQTSTRFQRCSVDDEVLLGISATVDPAAQPGVAYVVLSGELCSASAPVLADVLGELTTEGATQLHVDLSQLTFCMSRGVDVLEDARRRVEDGNGTFHLVGAHGVVRRVLEAAGFDLDGAAPLP